MGTLEDAIRAAGCPEVSLPDAAPARRTWSSTPVGPSDFVDQLWQTRAETPDLLQMQPVGLSVDPDPVLTLANLSCEANGTDENLYDSWYAESDLEGYSAV